MAESSFNVSLTDRIVGALYAGLYYTSRKRVLGFAISGWLKNLPLIFAPFAWLFGLGLGWSIFGIFIAIVVRMLYAVGKRAGYIRFIPEEYLQPPDNIERIRNDQKVPVFASGTFSVKDWERYVRQHAAQYWRVGMGDHVIMIDYASGRFLYQFIQPGSLEKVMPGKLCSGRQPDPALELTYQSNWGPESTDVSFMFYSPGKDAKSAKLRRKIYLSFTTPEQRQIVWNNLTGGQDQAEFKEN